MLIIFAYQHFLWSLSMMFLQHIIDVVGCGGLRAPHVFEKTFVVVGVDDKLNVGFMILDFGSFGLINSKHFGLIFGGCAGNPSFDSLYTI